VVRRSLSASLDRIAELARSLAPVVEDAADAGARRSVWRSDRRPHRTARWLRGMGEWHL